MKKSTEKARVYFKISGMHSLLERCVKIPVKKIFIEVDISPKIKKILVKQILPQI